MANRSIAPSTESVDRQRHTRFTPKTILLALLPLVLLGGVLALIVATNAGLGERAVPPIETLNINRVQLPEPGMIKLDVVNAGPDPITIAQVMVDEAYWQYEIAPGPTLEPRQSATVSIPYPWVQDETHGIGLLSETGVLFEAEIPVAIQSPVADRASFAQFALVGLYVGIVPVSLGLLWYPSMRRLGRRGMNFVLALTVGLLVFLAVDMWGEAQEIALAAAGFLDAPVLVPLLALLTVALLVVVGNALRGRTGESGGLALAYRIAGGIGLHNLGEGLAIGAAFALGEVALGVFLILGFTLHNVTEGVGIAAPVVGERPRLVHFAALAALAGIPAILGTWIGAFTYSPFWTTVFFAVGIGAILQVVYEVGRLIVRSQANAGEPAMTWTTFGGVAAGIAVMYATGLLVAA